MRDSAASSSVLENCLIGDDSGFCTNTVVGGLGPHHIPSGLDSDGVPDESLLFICSSSALDCISPAMPKDVFPSSCSDSDPIHMGSVHSEINHVDVPLIGQVRGQQGIEVTGSCSPSQLLGAASASSLGDTSEGVSVDPSSNTTCNSAVVNIPSVVVHDGIDYFRPCADRLCPSVHTLDGVPIQLNPCAFYLECFCHSSGPDENAEYIFKGVRDGFDIVDEDFDGSYRCSNYQSIMDSEFRQQMDSTIEEELSEGKVSLAREVPQCIHSLGAVRKSNGKLRPITDCSRPEGSSINNHMSSTCKEFTFTKLDYVAEVMTPGCWMAVLDLKSAYRTVHIAPGDRKFQGFVWNWQGENRCFEDNRLCFGIRCAPYIFSRLTEFILRCLGRRGYSGVFGYLDDFLVIGSTKEECELKLLALISVVRYLGFSIAWDKVVSPSTSLVYLGIEIDSEAMEFRLPDRKVDKLKHMVSEFSTRSHATKKELQCLAGHMSHASTVVRGGRTFSRRLLNLIKYIPDSVNSVSLPSWFIPDLCWWKSLVEVFNGSAKIIQSMPEAEGVASTDSSFSGFGGMWQDDWFIGSWENVAYTSSLVPDHHWKGPPDSFDKDMNINILEMWPILVAANRWGPSWRDRKVRVMTDNTQVLSMINTGRSSSVRCMFWIRELFWISFLFNFHLVASHIGTSCNVVPDYLSRCLSDRFIKVPSVSLTESLCCFQDWTNSTLPSINISLVG